VDVFLLIGFLEGALEEEDDDDDMLSNYYEKTTDGVGC
jgi:hypothetical protein